MKTYIRKSVEAMSGYVPGEQPKDPGIIKLNTNENPYPPSPRVAEALRGCEADRLRFYPDPVCRELRTAIAKLHGASPDQVFAGNGSDEVLALCTRAFVEDDGCIGYFDPSYSLYPVLAEIRAVPGKSVALGPQFDWCRPPRDFAPLFFLTCPNAPTGIRYPKAEIEAFCRGYEGVVVIDEAYVDFAGENCMDLALRLENVIVARTMSKSYALAGLRVGYAVGPAKLIAAMYKVKDSYNLDMLAQRLALAAVNDQAYMLEMAARIKATRARLRTALLGLGYTMTDSETNFLWVKPPAGTAAAAVFDGLRRRKILVRYFPGERTGDYLRITVGTDAEADALVAALQQMAEKGGV